MKKKDEDEIKKLNKIDKTVTSQLNFIMNYGWIILIIIIMVGALFSLGVFKVQPYDDYGESCKTLCKNQNLEYTSWGKVGGCIVCNCNKVIPMSCSD